MVHSFLAFQKSFKVTTEGGYNLKEELQKDPQRYYNRPNPQVFPVQTSNDILFCRPVVFISNHQTFLDAPLLAPLIAKLTTSGHPYLWGLDWQNWPFSAGSASLLFNHPVPATIMTLFCGVPVQPKWQAIGESHPTNILVQNRSRFLPDMIEVTKVRKMILFPEGRLYQDSIEPRDEQGCWTQFDGLKTAPNDDVGQFFTGFARIVAHTDALVVPITHMGLDQVQKAKNTDYKFQDCSYGTGADVRIHIGKPMDFGQAIGDMREKGFSFDDFNAPDTYCSEKKILYREIRDSVRTSVIKGRDACREAKY